ncbi:MAG: protein-L-isoaspartate O-methyltransferase [Candidatus Levybacteria bacterium]|nr:protein-L-isoaspartate O-methyltransferase [Candidatus Levybacteria bacterium]
MNEVRAHGLTQGDIDDRRERFDNNLERVMRSDFGVNNPLVFEAFRQVDRRAFAPVGLKALAYYDKIIPLNEDASSTISQPSLVGMMIDLLEPTGSGRVLEIGTASGYNAALLSKCYNEVDSIEHDTDLAQQASHTLAINGYQNVHVHTGDGGEGMPLEKEYDGIVVTAGAKSVPKPLLDHLKTGGRMVIPIGQDPLNQRLMVINKNTEGMLRASDRMAVTFVPFMSENGGWTEETIQRAARMKEYSLHFLDVLGVYMAPEEIAETLSQTYEKYAVPGFRRKVFPYLK